MENSFRSHFAGLEHELQAALDDKNPDVFWRLWSNATEEAIGQACAHNSGERRHFSGHGNATYMLTKHKASQVFQDNEQHAAFSTEATEKHRVKRQIHKILYHINPSKQIAMRAQHMGKCRAQRNVGTTHQHDQRNTDVVGYFEKKQTQSHTKHRTTSARIDPR